MLLQKCASRIIQQRKFESQSLGIGLCYSCGRVLWNPSHAHYSGLITPPSGMTPDDAPATAYLSKPKFQSNICAHEREF